MTRSDLDPISFPLKNFFWEKWKGTTFLWTIFFWKIIFRRQEREFNVFFVFKEGGLRVGKSLQKDLWFSTLTCMTQRANGNNLCDSMHSIRCRALSPGNTPSVMMDDTRKVHGANHRRPWCGVHDDGWRKSLQG